LVQFEPFDDGFLALYTTNDGSGNIALWAQKVLSDGSMPWGEAISISADILPGYNPRMVEVDGEMMIVRRESLDALETLVAQRIDTDGNQAFGVLGETLLPEGAYLGSFTLAATGNSFWVTWSDLDNEHSLYAMRFNAAAEPMLTDEPGVPFGSAGVSYDDPILVSDGGGGVYAFYSTAAVWQTQQTRYTHLLSDGSVARSEYGQEGVLLSEYWCNPNQIRGMADGNHGVMLVWADHRASTQRESSDLYTMAINDYTVEVENAPTAEVPSGWTLHEAYPNPFNPSTTIGFSVPMTSPVRLAVYDVLGREVAVLADRSYQAGTHRVTWNGRNTNNRPVASGVYFLRMDAGSVSHTGKLILMK
ncbi:T9SS type A sorting domain-containing protein, partial [bacterium]|nr:T9SS type A sorting domain-containing protein [bacterium]